jgi:hypothetical protein
VPVVECATLTDTAIQGRRRPSILAVMASPPIGIESGVTRGGACCRRTVPKR